MATALNAVGHRRASWRTRDGAGAPGGEALSNVARHARAGAADVALRVRDRRLTLAVEDDGVGIGDGGRRSGLRNLAERARRAGGGMSVEASAEGGTRLA
ncbi:hypothetical protein [Streptomyces lydicus]|uniref:hypothetical protein n=1 Tax=Streptomyces lydicus TaxID=47763 RepID=UPI0035BE7A51